MRRHSSFQPDRYQQQQQNMNDNPLIDDSASIEISIDLQGDSDMDLMPGGHVTRGPSISFPDNFKGHARRVSSGILNILKKIEAEPECSYVYLHLYL